MNKGKYFALTGLAMVGLYIGSLVPTAAQDQPQPGQGRQGGRQGRRGGQGGPGGFGGGFGQRGGMMGGMMGDDPTRSANLMLLQRDDVRTELSITSRQREQLDATQQKAMEAMRGNRPDMQALRDLPQEERQAKMAEFREKRQAAMKAANDELNTKTLEILTPAQQKRLSELDIQWRGPLALAEEATAIKAAVTPEQQKEITTILADYRKAQQDAMREIMGNMGGRGQRGNRGQGGAPAQPGQPQDGTPPQPGGAPGQGGRPQFDPEAMRARMEKMQKESAKVKKEYGDKVVALLTDEQKATWKTMRGKAFTFRTVN